MTEKFIRGLKILSLVFAVFFINCSDSPDGDTNIDTTSFDGKDTVINGIDFILVKAGTFTMGSPENQRQVTITHDFWISKFPITNAQYWGVVPGAENRPVVGISWYEANHWARNTGGRLPTEAEWEFAARGGNKSQGFIYSGSNNLDEVGWYRQWDWEDWHAGNVLEYGTREVGKKKPNELGIFDMSGNVWEWCADWYGAYGSEAQTNPTGPASGNRRVKRGGSWSDEAQNSRVASRNSAYPSYNYDILGFRVSIPRK